MKRIKALFKVIFGFGIRLKDVWPYATRWQTFGFKALRYTGNTIKITLIICAAYGYGEVRTYFFPNTVYAERRVEVPVENPSPVMDRIAKCESGAMHMKNGQVIIRANTNKTVDIGYYQINSIWNKKAAELGYDLTKEEDNKSFGIWLYKNFGTEPWVYSKTCWNK